MKDNIKEEIIKNISESTNISIREIERAIEFQSKFVSSIISSENPKTVKLDYFGKFVFNEIAKQKVELKKNATNNAGE